MIPSARHEHSKEGSRGNEEFPPRYREHVDNVDNDAHAR